MNRIEFVDSLKCSPLTVIEYFDDIMSFYDIIVAYDLNVIDYKLEYDGIHFTINSDHIDSCTASRIISNIIMTKYNTTFRIMIENIDNYTLNIKLLKMRVSG